MSLLRPHNVPTRTVDLQEILLDLADIIDDPSVSVWLFGSRRHRTRSPRSDIDVLIRTLLPISQEQAEKIWRLEPYLDVFEVSYGSARSIVNGSRIEEPTFADLVGRLDATLVFDEGSWVTSADEHRRHVALAERNPAATLVPLYDLEDAIPAERADILVLAALPLEYEAAVRALGGFIDGSPSTLCEVLDEKDSPWRVMVRTVNEMGSVGMALATADAIRRTKAAHVVLVGICAGISGRADLLDVIVPTAVAYYEPGKVTPQGIQQDYAHLTLNKDVAARAATLSDVEALRVKATGQVIGCGEKVIADKRERQRLEKTLSRKLTAIDMESYGMARAALQAGRFPTVIKTVCDLGDKKKDDSQQAEAAKRAASVLHRMIVAGAFAASK